MMFEIKLLIFDINCINCKILCGYSDKKDTSFICKSCGTQQIWH